MSKQPAVKSTVAQRIAADLRKISGKADAAPAVVAGWKELDPSDVSAALRAAWPKIRKAADRQQLLKAMYHGRHPAAIDALDLGIGDPDPHVKSWACEFLEGAAFRDFRGDPRGYAMWRTAVAGRTLDEVQRAGARGFVDALRAKTRAERPEASRSLFEAVRTGSLETLAQAGLVRLLEEWVTAGPAEVTENALRTLRRFPMAPREAESRLSAWLGSRDENVVRAALRHAGEFGVGDQLLRANVLPIVRGRPTLRSCALRALGRKGASWAVEHLVPWVSDSDEDVFLAAAEALAEIGDPQAVPAMIEALKADPSPTRIYALGNFGLSPLTGIEYDPRHDGNWWEGAIEMRGDGKKKRVPRKPVRR